MVAGNNGGLFGLPYEISIVLLIILLGMLAAVAYVLIRVRNKVKEINNDHALPAHGETAKGWFAKQWHWAATNLNLTIVVVLVMFIGTIGTTVMLYERAQDLGTQVGYAPEQPIKFNHVYFSHAQHVNAGKLACENCHGRVQEMERVQQVSTLEMGWCINCHRETKVDSTNKYYTSTFDFAKKHKSFTIGQLGGVECSKCHY
jgi:hypothetical protein